MKFRNSISDLFTLGALVLLLAGCQDNGDIEVTDPNLIPPINFNQSVTYGSLADIDGNTYKTVVIGNQTWMAENLKTTKYKDGTAIPNVTDIATWNSTTSGAYCWYDNNPANKNVYGALYNGYTIDTNKLCPANWHIPSRAEWSILSTFLGGNSLAGGKLKETGITHWDKPNSGANNEVGFTAIPSGSRITGGDAKKGMQAFWWTSTVYQPNLHGTTVVNYLQPILSEGGSYPTEGNAVRCVKD